MNKQQLTRQQKAMEQQQKIMQEFENLPIEAMGAVSRIEPTPLDDGGYDDPAKQVPQWVQDFYRGYNRAKRS